MLNVALGSLMNIIAGSMGILRQRTGETDVA